MRLPGIDELPSPGSGLEHVAQFVDRYDPAECFLKLWGSEYGARADALGDQLLLPVRAGQIPAADPEELLLVFCRLWRMAPYLGVDSAERFWAGMATDLVRGLRRQLEWSRFAARLPGMDAVPGPGADLKQVAAFVDRYDLTGMFRELWGGEYEARAEALEADLALQLRAGEVRDAAPEGILLVFTRLWRAAPFLGMDAAEHFGGNPLARGLERALRRELTRDAGIPNGTFRLGLDVYVDYGFEEVLHRWVRGTGRVFRRFYGGGEREVKLPNRLWDDAVLFGRRTTSDRYWEDVGGEG
jgi:hypothetical protein